MWHFSRFLGLNLEWILYTCRNSRLKKIEKNSSTVGPPKESGTTADYLGCPNFNTKAKVNDAPWDGCMAQKVQPLPVNSINTGTITPGKIPMFG